MHIKKTLLGIVILAAAGFFITGCSDNLPAKNTPAEQKAGNQSPETKNTQAKAATDSKGKKILIAYFSHTNHTKMFAEEIQKNVGGDFFVIEPGKGYPTDYDTVVAQAKDEVNSGFTPKLKQDIDTAPYDVIFIGTPVWWYTMAPPVRTFLKSHDLSGKTIIPFTTHKGSGLSGMEGKIKELQPKANVLNGFAVWNDTAKNESSNIAGWLKKLKI